MSLKEELQQNAKQYGMDFLYEVEDAPFVLSRTKTLSYNFVKENGVLPIDEQDGQVVVAVSSPFLVEAIEKVKFTLKKPVKEVLCLEPMLRSAIERCYHQEEGEASRYLQDLKEETQTPKVQALDGEYDLLDSSSDSAVIRMLNVILLEAIQNSSSDIHFEPAENQMMVRYRVDGLLQLRHNLPAGMINQITTRIKVMSKLDIAEHRLPQDGRIKLRIGGREVDFRVSTVPVSFGERIVLRILDNRNIILGLDRIGMSPETLATFRSYIHQNQGIILVTGPTGSGKTTTLYSALKEVQSDEMNIMTIEDPVEYKLPQMAQIGVNPKIDLTFAKGLRHILRQDPDVIMVGEIRDHETAEIAIQAALTGHLVFSTLHTNDAPSAITRLVDMGIEPFLLSSTLLCVLAQRLVREICPHCKTEYQPLPAQMNEAGLGDHLGPLYQGQGCSNCHNLGYVGRIGLYELMEVNRPLKQVINASCDANEIRDQALKNNMRSLRQDGATKVLEGKTTLSEVIRVTRKQ
jgi:general secretion pathway protein E